MFGLSIEAGRCGMQVLETSPARDYLVRAIREAHSAMNVVNLFGKVVVSHTWGRVCSEERGCE